MTRVRVALVLAGVCLALAARPAPLEAFEEPDQFIPSIQLEDRLRDALRLRAAGDPQAIEGWAEIERQAWTTIDETSASDLARERWARTCIDGIRHKTFGLLSEEEPALTMLWAEIEHSLFFDHLHAEHYRLAALSWDRTIDALDEHARSGFSKRRARARGMDFDQAEHHARAARSLLHAADRLWRTRLAQHEERALDLYRQAVDQARAAGVDAAARPEAGAAELDVALYALGMLALRAGEDDVAFDAFSDAVDRRPERHDVRFLLALTAKRRGKHGIAGAQLTALTDDSKAPGWLQRLAWQERVRPESQDDRRRHRGRPATRQTERDLLVQALARHPEDRGLRLLGLEQTLLVPPTVIDSSTYLTDSLAAAVPEWIPLAVDGDPERQLPRARLESFDRAELDGRIAAYRRDLQAVLGRVAPALWKVIGDDNETGRREIIECRRAGRGWKER